MRKVLIALVIALAVAPAASAKNPHDQTEPSPSTTTIVQGPTVIPQSAVPSGGLAAPTAGGAVPASSSCGACIATCWSSTTRSGPSDYSGHVYIYQHLSWCGNGAQITNASVWQSYDQYGWYSLSNTYGPWWSGGCVGCPSIRASGYILWDWSSPLIGFHQSGTSHLDSVMYAYGGLSF